MFICEGCSLVFEEPVSWHEDRGEYQGSPAFEEVFGCPYCGYDFVEGFECTNCGTVSGWISDEGLCDRCWSDENGKD